jgi:uridine kinase
MLSMDSFYRNLTPEERATVTSYDFDHPNAFEFDLLIATLRTLARGEGVDIPIYDFKTHSRSNETIRIEPNAADVVVVEGILTFFTEELRHCFDMKIYVHTDADERLIRRIRRDMAERARSLESVLYQYERFVKPAFDEFIEPSRKYADIIVPRGGSNVVAINLLLEHIKGRLQMGLGRSKSHCAVCNSPMPSHQHHA